MTPPPRHTHIYQNNKLFPVYVTIHVSQQASQVSISHGRCHFCLPEGMEWLPFQYHITPRSSLDRVTKQTKRMLSSSVSLVKGSHGWLQVRTGLRTSELPTSIPWQVSEDTTRRCREHSPCTKQKYGRGNLLKPPYLLAQFPQATNDAC